MESSGIRNLSGRARCSNRAALTFSDVNVPSAGLEKVLKVFAPACSQHDMPWFNGVRWSQLAEAWSPNHADSAARSLRGRRAPSMRGIQWLLIEWLSQPHAWRTVTDSGHTFGFEVCGKWG